MPEIRESERVFRIESGGALQSSDGFRKISCLKIRGTKIRVSNVVRLPGRGCVAKKGKCVFEVSGIDVDESRSFVSVKIGRIFEGKPFEVWFSGLYPSGIVSRKR